MGLVRQNLISIVVYKGPYVQTDFGGMAALATFCKFIGKQFRLIV